MTPFFLCYPLCFVPSGKQFANREATYTVNNDKNKAKYYAYSLHAILTQTSLLNRTEKIFFFQQRRCWVFLTLYFLSSAIFNNMQQQYFTSYVIGKYFWSGVFSLLQLNCIKIQLTNFSEKFSNSKFPEGNGTIAHHFHFSFSVTSNSLIKSKYGFHFLLFMGGVRICSCSTLKCQEF